MTGQPNEQPNEQPNAQPLGKASFGATMKAVFWSFFGVRKGSDRARDFATLNPVYIVIAALIGAAMFIGVLIMLVQIAVAK